MTFFNKKEDVIAIELTPHGRKLLSMGKLKPEFYAFFDDDILYDSQRGGFSENNSQTKNRILSETVYLRPQTNYRGVETNINDEISYESENKMIDLIGTNKAEEKESNGWQVKFLHNTASATTTTFSSPDSPTMQIPQIDCTIEYKLRFAKKKTRAQRSQFSFRTNVNDYGESNEIVLDEQQVLLSILESNGFNHGEGLEIEVHLFEQDKKKYKKLDTFPKDELVVNDILLSSEVNFSDIFKTEQAPMDPNFVESWLTIRVDDDISIRDRCSGLKNLYENDIYLDTDFECPDVEGPMANIYSTSVSEIEDCEE